MDGIRTYLSELESIIDAFERAELNRKKARDL